MQKLLQRLTNELEKTTIEMISNQEELTNEVRKRWQLKFYLHNRSRKSNNGLAQSLRLELHEYNLEASNYYTHTTIMPIDQKKKVYKALQRAEINNNVTNLTDYCNIYIDTMNKLLAEAFVYEKKKQYTQINKFNNNSSLIWRDNKVINDLRKNYNTLLDKTNHMRIIKEQINLLDFMKETTIDLISFIGS